MNISKHLFMKVNKIADFVKVIYLFLETTIIRRLFTYMSKYRQRDSQRELDSVKAWWEAPGCILIFMKTYWGIVGIENSTSLNNLLGTYDLYFIRHAVLVKLAFELPVWTARAFLILQILLWDNNR